MVSYAKFKIIGVAGEKGGRVIVQSLTESLGGYLKIVCSDGG